MIKPILKKLFGEYKNEISIKKYADIVRKFINTGKNEMKDIMF